MRKPNNLKNLIAYTIQQNPRGVQKLGNSYGELPYNYREPIGNYLTKVCLNIVKNEGIEALLLAHPDRNLFKTKFESEFVNAQKDDKLSLSNSIENKKKAVSEPNTMHSFTHFKQVPISSFTSSNDFSNFFGAQQNEEQNNSTKTAFWAIGIVVLIMLSFFFMHLLNKK